MQVSLPDTRVVRRVFLSVPYLVMAACSEPAASNAPATVKEPDAVAIQSVGDDLGRLRAAGAQFQNIDTATGDEYSQITGCMVDPMGSGGMGFHYAKADAFDGVVDPVAPKALLYEPDSNGRLRLVAVEFIVPYTVASREGPAPRLFEQDFVHNDDFQIWMLHAWIWKNNPAGTFATWNPNVNCDAVPAAQRMSHN